MKSTFAIFLILSFVLLACQEQTQKTESIQVPSQIQQPIDSLLYRTSPLLQTIWGNEYGKLRGFALGDSIQKVLAQERGILAEDSLTYKGFTQSFSANANDEFVDILYNTNAQGIVTGMTLDVFLNSQSQTDSLMAECREYCNKKYGAGLEKKLEIVWTMPDRSLLVLRDMSIKQAAGFQLKLMNGKK